MKIITVSNISEDLFLKLKNEAKERELSVSALIRLIIKQYFSE